ncbi:ion channel [Rothia dentocariosa]|jgi:putative voltage-gated potassium channel protein|uniref:potassium channel family protein n=1 Tax=Rothia TaxID=32207 RepID=UPI0008A3C8F3|nr:MULTISPECIES: ion channel [Rothia]MCM3437518.1 ion channel [Rothia dentocariosa]OFR97465.1 voltage-gated potassium channel [Rothia sp. HMSC067H10]
MAEANGTETPQTRTVPEPENTAFADAAADHPHNERRPKITRGEEGLTEWERRTDKPLFIASLLYLVAYAAPIVSTRISAPLDGILNIFQMILWALFAVDYCVRLYLAPRRIYFFTHNLMNLAIVLLPAWRIVSFLAMLHMTANRQYKLLSELAVKLFGYTLIFVIMAALAIFSIEQGAPGALIKDIWTAYWWTLATLATVGYGDVYPVTVPGRVIAVVVMIYGVGLFGVITGALATWVIEKISGVTEEDHAATKADIEALHAEIAELKAMLAIRMGDGTVHHPPEELTQEFLASHRNLATDNEEDDHEPEQPMELLEETKQTLTVIRQKIAVRLGRDSD